MRWIEYRRPNPVMPRVLLVCYEYLQNGLRWSHPREDHEFPLFIRSSRDNCATVLHSRSALGLCTRSWIIMLGTRLQQGERVRTAEIMSVDSRRSPVYTYILTTVDRPGFNPHLMQSR